MDWRNKRVLVTGACGFIGSHLVERLVDLGASVRAFVYYNSFNQWGWIDTFSKDRKNKIEVFCGDVRDRDSACKAMEDMEYVFHLAALIAIPYSYQSPESYVQTNVIGTLNLLQAANKKGVKRFMQTSTSEVYGTAKYVPIDERHPLCGQSPYAATKIAADSLAESFYRSFELPVVIVRPFNTYGPRQSARAVIPTIITQILSGVQSIQLGAKHPTRDFTFVKDVVDGFIKLAEVEEFIGTITNIGSNQEISIGELANTIRLLMNSDIPIQFDENRLRPRESEVERLCADNSKLSKMTNWKPSYSLEDGLKKTVNWMKENIRYYKADLYNL